MVCENTPFITFKTKQYSTMRNLLETIAIFLPSVYYIVLFLATMANVLQTRTKIPLFTFLMILFFMFVAPIMISVFVWNGFNCAIMSLLMIGLLSLIRVNVSGIKAWSVEIIFILGNIIYLAYLFGTSLK